MQDLTQDIATIWPKDLNLNAWSVAQRNLEQRYQSGEGQATDAEAKTGNCKTIRIRRRVFSELPRTILLFLNYNREVRICDDLDDTPPKSEAEAMVRAWLRGQTYRIEKHGEEIVIEPPLDDDIAELIEDWLMEKFPITYDYENDVEPCICEELEDDEDDWPPW